jgi:hypothetical protein
MPDVKPSPTSAAAATTAQDFKNNPRAIQRIAKGKATRTDARECEIRASSMPLGLCRLMVVIGVPAVCCRLAQYNGTRQICVVTVRIGSPKKLRRHRIFQEINVDKIGRFSFIVDNS